MEFIELLKNMKTEKCPTYSIHRIHKDWIERKHLPKLIELVNSDEPCANVSMTISSVLDCTKSTVGKEAAFLIKGFVENRYPPELNSGRFDYDIEEIKSWWQNYRNKIYNEEQKNANSANEKVNLVE